MKRVNDDVAWGSENLGQKKIRSFSETDGIAGGSKNTEAEELSPLTGNEVSDSAQGIRSADVLGNKVSDCFEGPSLDGQGVNKLDLNINLNLIFDPGEVKKALGLDLNIPVLGIGHGGMVDGFNSGSVDVIEIVSDESDDDLEFIDYSNGGDLKGKQVEVGMPDGRMENLNLGLGTTRIDNFVGGSSSMIGCDRVYMTGEQKMPNAGDTWLSLAGDHPIDLDLLPDSEEPPRINESNENSELRRQPAESPSLSHSAENRVRERRQALYLQNRDSYKETAKEFARAFHSAESSGNGTSSKEQKPPALGTVEQFGSSSGPFSEALKMVNERTLKRKAHQLIEWKPSKANQDHSGMASFVPSLLDLSLNALAENAEGMVSLEMIPDGLRRRLTNKLCDARKMNVHFLSLLAEGLPTEIRVKNCAWLTEKQFQQTLGNCEIQHLKVLQLDLCGQCWLDLTFLDTLSRSSKIFSSLAILSLRGACRLSDNGVQTIVKSAPSLQSINLGHCSLLTCDAIKFIADSLGSNMKELYIDDCQKIDPMLILPALKKLKHLEVLSVASIQSVTDQFVSEMIMLCGRNIKELDLADCRELTDWSLKTIGSGCPDLRALNISNLNNLTDVGLEYLANGCRLIQNLRLCRARFSDEAVAAFLEACGESLIELVLNNVAKVGPHTALSLAKRSRKLLSLDMSWCRKISNEALGLIADSCPSLKMLKVFGCRQITSVFLNGHSNPHLRIIGLHLAPLLEHVNLFEPDEVLLRYSPLPDFTEA